MLQAGVARIDVASLMSHTSFGIANSLAIIWACNSVLQLLSFWSFVSVWSASAQFWNIQSMFYQLMQDTYYTVLTNKCVQPFPKLVLSLFLPSSVLPEVFFFSSFWKKVDISESKGLKLTKKTAAVEEGRYNNDSCSPFCVKPVSPSVWNK